jgi:DNA-binding CsgD family transcriptional regulator
VSWTKLDPDFRALAESVCTEKELEALRLTAAGYSQRRIAEVLGVGRQAVRDRLASAARKIRQAGPRVAA